jgi:hypothetical protein
MDKESSIEIFFGLLGMFLMWISMSFKEVQYLGWIGVWVVVISLFWYYHRMRKKARKQGKDILL